MSEQTGIEWCDSTFNPWIGCQKVGPGCDHCYAERSTPARTLGIAWGAGAERRRTSAANWRQPLLWNKHADAFELMHGRRRRVFCASLADVFDNAVPHEWREDLYELIYSTPNLDWLLLTKRIGNVKDMLPVRGRLPSHVWLGATVVNQQEADRDIPKLLAVPARRRWLSCEPLLGPIDLTLIPHNTGYGSSPCAGCGTDVARDALTGHTHCQHGCDGPILPGIDWIVAGGESGPKARPMHPAWVRSLRDQCAAADVPFLFKQWGEWAPRSACYHVREDGTAWADADPSSRKWPVVRLTEAGHDGRQLKHAGVGDDAYMQRVGKHAAGRLLDGVLHDAYPASAEARP